MSNAPYDKIPAGGSIGGTISQLPVVIGCSFISEFRLDAA
jgi:hypothetical protein